MSKIQVIALNDDNHSKCYVTRGSYYHDMADFAKECLLKSHTCEYEIREVYICDPQGELAKLDEDEFLYMFDLLDLTNDPGKLFQEDEAKWKNREIAFDLFWENGDVWNYA
jgi:hypothetical protein